MSFAGTPLGQDRRLDRQAFLGRVPSFSHQATSNPLRRLTSINSSAPLTFTHGTRPLTVAPSGPSQATRPQSKEDENKERRVRDTQSKQHKEALANHPGLSLGPRIITTPPQPTPASLKDTSVLIASAFNQALFSSEMDSANFPASWTNGRSNLPRSTSVEYEESVANVTRRFPAPQRRVGSSKPPSKASSVANGADNNQDDSAETVGPNGRSKSPFDTLADLTARAVSSVSSATFLMRQRSHEAEESQRTPRLSAGLDQSEEPRNGSYDYADEEQNFNEMEESQEISASKRVISSVHRRHRTSFDNKPYRPTASEEESDDGGDGERKGRRKKRTHPVDGGPLRTLPVITEFDKKKKRRSRGGRPGEEDTSLDIEQDREQDEHERRSDTQSHRSATPAQRQPSTTPAPMAPQGRASVPPVSRVNALEKANESADIEQGLESIPEFSESGHQGDARNSRTLRRGSRPRSRSHSRTRSTRPKFSIGAFLGTLVNMVYRCGQQMVISIFRLVSILTLFFGRLLRSILDILILQPVYIVRRGLAIQNLGKYVVSGLVFYLAYLAAMKGRELVSTPIPQRATYTAPIVPPENVDELTARLLKLENVMAGHQAEISSERDRLDYELRRARDLMSRVGMLETRVENEITHAQNMEDNTRLSAFKGLEAVQRDIRALKSQYVEVSSQPTGGPAADEEARIRLRLLEDRLNSVEGDVKEAVELSQSIVRSGSAATGGTQWWSKIRANSDSASQGKVATGDKQQDAGELIQSAVKELMSHYTADGIARIDYALASGGGSVIPSLTSPTLEVRTPYFFGLLSGATIYARPPVTALHHEVQLGYCWPFAGSKGHLGVKLVTPVRITDFTVDHVPHANAYDLRPAPRHMEVWGFVEGEDNLSRLREYRARKQAERDQARRESQPEPEDPTDAQYPEGLQKDLKYMRIAGFMYDAKAPENVQTFPVFEEIKELGMDFGIVVLYIKSNWGHDEFTCLYRFRTHGERVQSLPSLDS